jgi:multiple sugar transport system substrate-binding protein/raffinose/stachyose/melibiose transport system substrate-binding protein
MYRRSLAATAAAAVAAAVLLAACSSSGSPAASSSPASGSPASSSGTSSSGTSPTKATLTYMTFLTPDLTASFWSKSIAAAEQAVPGVTIKQVVDPTTDRDTYAKTLLQSGQFPDLLQSITPSLYTSAGLLTPFPASWISANFILPNNIKGQDYIPPTNSQIIPLVYYNKALFAKAGVTPPKTWAQFMADCAALKAHGVVPIELGGHDSFAAAMPLTGALSADVLGANPNWIQQRYAGTVKFADANVVAAATKMRTLVTDGYFEPDALSVSYADSITNFNAGKAAMYPMGSWYLGSIPKSEWGNIGVFPWPTDNGSLVIPFSLGGSMAVSSKSPDQAGAVKFAESWSLNPDNLKSLISGDGAFPMLKGKSLASYGLTLSPAFNSSYSYVTATNTKVSSMSWATNDDALPGNVTNDFDAAAQALFSTSNVLGQMQQLDQDWTTATASS